MLKGQFLDHLQTFILVCSLCRCAAFYNIIDHPYILSFLIFDALIQARCQVLHFEETLVDESLALPRMNVLADQGVYDQFKHVTGRNRDVVPTLIFQ